MKPVFCLILLLIGLFHPCIAQQSQAIDINKYHVQLQSDTIFEAGHNTITTKIFFNENKLELKATFRQAKDFSFYYPELYDTIQVYLNGKLANNTDAKYAPSIQKYFLFYDTAEVFNLKNEQAIVLLGWPFFCNGHYCSDISVLVIIQEKDNLKCLEINTGFCDYSHLISLIHSNTAKTKNLMIPVITDCAREKKPAWVKVN